MKIYSLEWYHSIPSYRTIRNIESLICLNYYFKETSRRAILDYQNKLRVWL